jgi:TRAP-type C4-dicarboxylate transport system permease small subunit
MRRVLTYLDDHFEETLLIIFASILVIALTYSAIVRYFLPYPFFTSLSHKAEELAIYSFVAQLYFGASLAARDGSHFRVTAQFMFIPESIRKWFYVPGEIIWQGLNVFLVWQGFHLVNSAFQTNESTIALQMPMWIVYAIIPVAFLNTLIRLLQRHLKGKFGPDAVSVEEEI